jgi:site-specific DNA-cytosine methylase
VNRWQTLLAIDFDPWAAKTYAANFPGVEVRTASVADEIDNMPDADVILGGPPCQPFSTAGEGKGKDDARDCIPDFLAAVRKVRPRMFLMENVPGLLNERHARYLGGIVREMEGMGYAVDARELDAVNYGVPQFRKRVWYWGIRTDVHAEGVRHRWPKPTHAWPPPDECMFGGNLPAAVTVGQALGLDGELHRKRGKGMTDRAGGRRDHPTTEPCPAITAAFSLGGGGGLFIIPPRQNGCPHQLQYDHGLAVVDEPSPTLKAGGNTDATGKQGGGCPPAIEYRWSDAMLEKHPPASPAPTVQAKWFKGGAEGLLSVDGRTWESRHPIPGADEPMPTVRARGPRDGGRCTEQVIRDGPKVRRLTPLECLRLQSGPDDFRWPEGITKTAMYRVVGNGWACGIAAHLGRALGDADPKSRTVIDLFCGGGLGACGWHGRYWTFAAHAEAAQ